MDCRPRHPRIPARLAPFALVALGLLLPQAAKATEFQVVNQGGVPQAAVDVYAGTSAIGPSPIQTDAYGRVNILATPGQKLYFSRFRTAGPAACQPPEGQGVTYTFPGAPGPASETITLPNVLGSGTSPALNLGERGSVATINKERIGLGLPALKVSLTLNDLADRYASYGAAAGLPWQTPDDHCFLSGPEVRAIDIGWPVRPDLLEINQDHNKAPPTNLDDLQNDPRFALIGIARVADNWTVVLSPEIPPGTPGIERAQITADTGIDPPEEEVERLDPHFKLIKLTHHDRRFRIKASIDPEAKGPLIARVYRVKANGVSQRDRIDHVKRRRGKITIRGKVPVPDRWKIIVTFWGNKVWAGDGFERSVRFD